MHLTDKNKIAWATAQLNRHDYELNTREGVDPEVRAAALQSYDEIVARYGPVMTEDLESPVRFVKPPTFKMNHPKGGPKKDSSIRPLRVPVDKTPTAALTERELDLMDKFESVFVPCEGYEHPEQLIHRLRIKLWRKFKKPFLLFIDRTNDIEGATVLMLEGDEPSTARKSPEIARA